MGCRHENADHLQAGEASTWGGPLAGVIAQCQQFRCLDCGAWLSLGPANDTPEVLVEVRAATIAAHGDYAVIVMSQCEWFGWSGYSGGMAPYHHELAGYLARAIIDHDREQAAIVEHREVSE